MSEDFEHAIKFEFLEEALEIIEDLEKELLQFEKSPKDKQVTSAIFRALHTLKGSAMAAGFRQLGDFAHKVESVLSAVRDDKVYADPPLIKLLFDSSYKIKDWLHELRDDISFEEEEGNINKLEGELYDVLGEEQKTAPVDEGAAFGFFDDDDDDDKNTSPAAEVPNGADFVVHNEEQMRHIWPEKAHVVVVDDEEDIVTLYKDMFDAEFIEVKAFCDATEALKFIENNFVTLIISDLSMPKMDGITFIKKVRDFDDTLPVIFVSGHAKRDDVIKFIELGVFGFMEKPFDFDALMQMYANALRMKSIKDAVMKLSAKNFRAYMQMDLVFSAVDKEKLGSNAAKNLEDTLEDIRDIVTCIVKAPF